MTSTVRGRRMRADALVKLLIPAAFTSQRLQRRPQLAQALGGASDNSASRKVPIRLSVPNGTQSLLRRIAERVVLVAQLRKGRNTAGSARPFAVMYISVQGRRHRDHGEP